MTDYAVNVADLTKHRDHLAQMMLMMLVEPVIRGQQVVKCGRKRFDGDGVLLVCDEQRALAICEVIRLKLDKRELRLYERRRTAWRRMP